MLGRTHVAQGVAVWLGGCALSTVAGWPMSPEVVVVGTVVAAGASLLPDADHRSGTLANVARPLSAWLCDKVADLSAWVFRRTGNAHDRADDDYRATGHRTLTHTVAAGMVVGLVTAVLAGLVPHAPAAMVGVLATLAAQAVAPQTRVRTVERWRRVTWPRWLARLLRRVGRLARRTKRAAVVWPVGAATGWLVDHHHVGGWWLGLVVAAGWLTHLAGDACSTQGVPLWWPIRVRGRRWRMVGLWQPLRVHTGSRAERAHAVAAVVLALAGSGWLLVGT